MSQVDLMLLCLQGKTDEHSGERVALKLYTRQFTPQRCQLPGAQHLASYFNFLSLSYLVSKCG